ncbi:MAG: PrpF family protein [Alphaproteobacteria bacterium]|nr:PrpF family protein [Alphaproteobacteria bacterium]
MTSTKIPAVFMRGGSSKAVVFHGRDLPADRAARDAIFLHVLGSPDPYQRQLDGMGGGLSSVSKAVIVEPSARPDADVDYTFAQVSVDRPVVDYGANCGNMSAAVGPFAVDEGLVAVADGEAVVRVYNTNTDKLYHARFRAADGAAVEEGDFAIPGVSGTGARITLDYLDPGGAATSALLPSGSPRDRLEVDGVGSIEVSLVDATNPVVFVMARDVGCTATEPPEHLEADPTVMARLDAIRRAGGVAMGMAKGPAAVGLANPKGAMLGPAADSTAIDGRVYPADTHDLSMRIVSMERVHRAVTLTGAMCTAVAARIEGTIPHGLAGNRAPLRIGNPSGVLPVEAEVIRQPDGSFHARSATTYRTHRRLMEGQVLVPMRLLSAR